MKTYKREGRRFVEIPNYEGYYYNEDGTFSKEKKGLLFTNMINKSIL